VLYGSQAFSGVINIVTKSASLNTVSVSAALGTDLHNNVTAHANYKFGDFGLVVAGRYADRSGWETTWEAPQINPMTGGPFVDANGTPIIDRVKVDIPDYGPGLFGELSFKGIKAMVSYNQWTNHYFVPDYQGYAKNFHPISTDATGDIVWTKLFGDIGYEHTFNDIYSASINATYTRSQLETKSFPNNERDGYEIVVEQTNFFIPVENFKITLGEVWGFMTGEEGNTITKQKVNKDHNQNTFSSYLQADYKWNWVKAIGGIQMNKVEGFDADFNPRGGLILYPIDNVNIKALYSVAYRAPSLDELYLDDPTMRGQMVERNDNDIIKERKLKPEKVNTFDLGLNYQDSTVQFGINGFHSKLKNLIIQDRDLSHYSIPTWDNIGDVTIFGLECEGKAYLTREILVEGSFLYQESRDENTSEENVTPLPTFSVKGGVSYMGHGLTVSAFNTYSQALDERYSAKLNKTNKYINMLNLYCSYDFNELIKSSFLKNLSLVLSVDNLLDEEIWLPAWGLNLGSTIPYNEGRVIYGGFKFSF
ncbi:MAG: TonB-dependent receptor, partial [Fibrobacter sp.]|nr:TonB-dependent receptor [Fibrobacter sp.]